MVNNLCRNINSKRGASVLESFEYSSDPMGLHPISSEKDYYGDRCSLSPKIKNRYEKQHYEVGRSEIKSSTEQMTNGVSPAYVIESAESGSLDTVNNTSDCVTHASVVPTPIIPSDGPCYNDRTPQESKTYSQVLRHGERTCLEENKQWILVQKNKFKNRFIGNKGKAIVESNVNFKAADIRIPLYIYNIAKNVTKEDIISYVKNKTDVPVDLEKVVMKMPKDYDAYKVYVPKSQIKLFLNDEFWPEGVAFRRFIDFKERHRSGFMPNSTLNIQQ